MSFTFSFELRQSLCMACEYHMTHVKHKAHGPHLGGVRAGPGK